ncbi:hypothetical protein L249_2349 [Ophiocordyceps polyrhachis-furcata BCC 54312]|uniref:Uncharacterized protein n=1 Tax=Ophiocordyceps polyrhachis-furcata BCC 54312 TaxID=1330021 RepID=A0A367LRN8_9HYPO|nr:hypothetical protein L249_2349 [Ophiocordyceps polyrhachis-furcata BCC 54312]
MHACARAHRRMRRTAQLRAGGGFKKSIVKLSFVRRGEGEGESGIVTNKLTSRRASRCPSSRHSVALRPPHQPRNRGPVQPAADRSLRVEHGEAEACLPSRQEAFQVGGRWHMRPCRGRGGGGVRRRSKGRPCETTKRWMLCHHNNFIHHTTKSWSETCKGRISMPHSNFATAATHKNARGQNHGFFFPLPDALDALDVARACGARHSVTSCLLR